MKILRVKTLQEKIYESLELKYKTEMAEAEVILDLYYNNPVGIGEHPQIVEEIDKSIVKLGEAKDKLQTLQETYKK
ncbi:hypothetical protein N9P74_00140 [bacterium]|nr:hypothetical protein [bacterium]MDB0072860.1 hypothetical protein [bacterium]|tara:strand:- start:11642 stop:11869 length:228 start_codon:yes stop_codon:yes gene_type:complete